MPLSCVMGEGGGGGGGGGSGSVSIEEVQLVLARLGEVAAESGEEALMVLVGDMTRRIFFLQLSCGDVAACEEVCARRGEEDLWQLLVVWAGELGHSEVQARALEELAKVSNTTHTPPRRATASLPFSCSALPRSASAPAGAHITTLRSATSSCAPKAARAYGTVPPGTPLCIVSVPNVFL